MATISAARTKQYAALKVKQATGPLSTKEAAALDTITLALAPARKRKAKASTTAKPGAASATKAQATKAKGSKK